MTNVLSRRHLTELSRTRVEDEMVRKTGQHCLILLLTGQTYRLDILGGFSGHHPPHAQLKSQLQQAYQGRTKWREIVHVSRGGASHLQFRGHLGMMSVQLTPRPVIVDSDRHSATSITTIHSHRHDMIA